MGEWEGGGRFPNLEGNPGCDDDSEEEAISRWGRFGVAIIFPQNDDL